MIKKETGTGNTPRLQGCDDTAVDAPPKEVAVWKAAVALNTVRQTPSINQRIVSATPRS